jgi:tetratricopeptide (TPR) repeat protein
MGPCLSWYFEVNGYYDEALSVFKAAWEGMRAHGVPAKLKSAKQKAVYASMLDQVGWFEFRKGNVEKGAVLLAESLEIALEAKDPEILYYVYGNWGYLALWQGHIDEAERLTIESFNYSRELTPWHTAIPLSVLGIVAYQQGKFNKSSEQLSESLEIWRTVGDPRGLVFCMLYLGMTARALGDFDTAESILKESNAIAEANMDRWAHAFGLNMLGMISLKRQENQQALEYFKHSLSLSREINDQLNATQSLVHTGQAIAGLGDAAEANRIFKKAYPVAREANWVLVVINTLLSYIELGNELLPETKLAVATSVLNHPGTTPTMRSRCEKIWAENQPLLTKQQVKNVELRAKEKAIEEWADEIILQS